MSQARLLEGPAAVLPELPVADVWAAYWLAQVNLRVRREVAWCWHQREASSDPGDGRLPRVIDAASDALDWVRFRDQKARFFRDDVACAYLGRELGDLAPPLDSVKGRAGSWSAIRARLSWSRADEFVLALAVAQRLDSGLGPIFATLGNDLSRPFPTLAIAQRLWDEPWAIAANTTESQAAARVGLLRFDREARSGLDWQHALTTPAEVARMLCGLGELDQAGPVEAVTARPANLDEGGKLLAWRLSHELPERADFVPLVGAEGTNFERWAVALSREGSRPLLTLSPGSAVVEELELCAALAWQRDADLLLPEEFTHDEKQACAALAKVAAIPVRWFVPVSSRRALAALPRSVVSPAFDVPTLSYEQRVEHFELSLGPRAAALRGAIAECARRFRLGERSIERMGRSLRGRPRLDEAALLRSCRAEARAEMGNLARRVKLRFTPEELVLPPAQAQQFAELVTAMRTLTRVHYEWGTARVWNEGGLSVLFCGPPGTGKTMAAEALASALSLDMYRVDLSQVINKYIGETEKNLARIFDAAERSDCLLFFDEADALFGKRTEVKDAHDRFANVEISYLLERMERLEGLAVLATNRRKDLDEAFARRLRYVIEFPVPDVEQRRALWARGFPEQVDISELDLHYLAKNFALSGGHIRSVIFNACLQAAAEDAPGELQSGCVGRVRMPDVVRQLRRELQKINRPAGAEQFGDYAGLLEGRG